jgi:hypothetical protein
MMNNNFNSMQDLQGINPVFQNATAQQQLAQQAMAQGGQLAQQALGTPQQIQMANALRQGNATQPKDTQLKLNQMYEIARLGSNPLSSTSDYMTGANGWGNYGE